jgi:hypothetical protein
MNIYDAEKKVLEQLNLLPALAQDGDKNKILDLIQKTIDENGLRIFQLLVEKVLLEEELRIVRLELENARRQYAG